MLQHSTWEAPDQRSDHRVVAGCFGSLLNFLRASWHNGGFVFLVFARRRMSRSLFLQHFLSRYPANVTPIKVGIDDYSFIYSQTYTHTHKYARLYLAGFFIYKKNAVHNVGRVVTLV